MDDLEKRVMEIAEQAIEEAPGLFIVESKIKGNVGNQKVLIFLDGDDGINIDQCSKLSRSVANVLEEEDVMPGKYFLEVSSPGLDHPIKLKRQYKKNKGRDLEVETKNGEKLKGKLMEVDNDSIVLESKNGSRTINFSEIDQSKIEVSFK